jgi:hypothetical protein
MDASTSVGSTCRDMMSDCSTEIESNGDETDEDASVMVALMTEDSGRRGEASAEIGDIGACTPANSMMCS